MIQLESYSIKSQKTQRWNNCHNLRNWNLEVSEDKSNWILVDTHKDDSRLNGNDLVANFQIDNNNFDSLWVYPINTIITAVNYNLIENPGSVKGISLNFSSYDVDGFYVIEKQIEST